MRHLRGLVVDALKPLPPVQTPDNRDLDDQPMVEELDPEETQDPTTYVYEIETGAYYWVIATNPAEALKILDETMDNWDEECGPGTGNMTIHVPPLERLNSLCFYDENENTHARFAAEYNRDPSPRMMACSEW